MIDSRNIKRLARSVARNNVAKVKTQGEMTVEHPEDPAPSPAPAATPKLVAPKLSAPSGESLPEGNPYQQREADIMSQLSAWDEMRRQYNEDSKQVAKNNKQTQLFGGIAEGAAALVNLFGTIKGGTSMKWDSPQPAWAKTVNEINSQREARSQKIMEQLRSLRDMKNRVYAEGMKYEDTKTRKDEESTTRQENATKVADARAANIEGKTENAKNESEAKVKNIEGKTENEAKKTESKIKVDESTIAKNKSTAAANNALAGQRNARAEQIRSGEDKDTKSGGIAKIFPTGANGAEQEHKKTKAEWNTFYKKYAPQVADMIARQIGFEDFAAYKAAKGNAVEREKLNARSAGNTDDAKIIKELDNLLDNMQGQKAYYETIEKYIRNVPAAMDELRNN